MADESLGTVVKVGMNSSQFNGGIADVNRQIKLLDANFRLAAEQAKALGDADAKLKVEQDALTKKIELQAQKVEILKKRYEESVKAKGEDNKRTIDLNKQYINAETQLVKLESALKDVNVQLNKQGDNWATAQKNIANIGEKAEAMAPKLNKIGDGLIRVTAPIVALGAAGGKIAVDFEDAMAKVSTIADTSQVSMEDLGTGVLELSEAFGIANTDIAEALYQTISAGVETRNALTTVAIAGMTARGGFASVTDSVDILTSVMNAYGKEIGDTINVSDQLFVMQNFGKTTIADMGTELGRVAPLAANAKVSTESLFSALAVLTRNGIRSSEAITGMKAVLTNVIKPSAEAVETARSLGLQFNATALQSKGLSQFLTDVMNRTHGNTETMAKLFGSVEALNSIMVLTSQNGSADFTEAMGLMTNSAGTTEVAFDRMQTTGFSIGQSWQEIRNAGIKMLPVVAVVAQVFAVIAEVLGKVNPALLQTVVVISGIGLVIGGIIKTIANVTGAIGGITSIMAMGRLEMMKTVGIILTVIGSLLILLAILTILMGKSGEVKSTFASIGAGVGSLTGSINASSQQIRLPQIPAYASGTMNHPGGPAIINEEGPEIVDLPSGSRVYPTGTGPTGGDIYVMVHSETIQKAADFMRIVESAQREKRSGVAPTWR